VDVKALFGTLPRQLTLHFEKGTVISEIYTFSDGELPDWVQVWQPPCEQTDLMLLSTHSDDEQLFFAGVLPYYAIERQMHVQVVYSVQHFEVYGEKNHQRPHEQLDGLWTVGVRHYPIISEFPDLYAESKDRDTAFAQAKSAFKSQGVTYDDFVSYITECIRRCKPLVVVSHDPNGEYGHGAHVLTVAALTDALQHAADESFDPESAAAYGTWSVEKTYLHLYVENPIVMDFDTPLDSMGGKTPFQMTQEGFGCHKSQHWTWFYKWIYGTSDAPIEKAADIKTYSPCLYGLYASSVGADSEGGDFFENVMTYAQRAEAEAKAKAEADAAAKAEAEAKAKAEAEAAAKAEAEAKAAAEAARAEKIRKTVLPVTAAAVILLAAFFAVALSRRRGKRQQKR
jgi:LmbE family N-acetylglucosaminyl deacetylase